MGAVHPECDIILLEKGKLVKLPVQYWIDRLKKTPKPLDRYVTFQFSDIKITGNAAIAIIEIFSKTHHKEFRLFQQAIPSPGGISL